MGGSSSKSVVNQVAEQISNIAISTVQDCVVTSTQNQNIQIGNTGLTLGGTISAKQQTDVSSQCFNDVKKQVDLQNKIIQAISQAVSAQNVALLGSFGSTSSDATTNLTNIIRNNVTMSNIQKSYTAIKQTQTVGITNSGVMIGTNIDLSQGAQIFAAATLQEVDKAGVFNQIQSHIDQQSSSSVTGPLNIFGNLFGSMSSYVWIFILFIICIVAGFFIWNKFVAQKVPDV